MLLEIEDVTVAYDARVAAEQVDFALAPGSIGCLLGPSGSGKSTVLRAIAGFEPVRAGRIVVGGHEMSTPRRHVPPERPLVTEWLDREGRLERRDDASDLDRLQAEPPKNASAWRAPSQTSATSLGSPAGGAATRTGMPSQTVPAGAAPASGATACRAGGAAVRG